MPSSPCDDVPCRSRPRLEASLLRLHRDVFNNVERNLAMDSMFAEWHGRWSGRREELIRRLEAIDTQLEGWLPPDESSLRLAVVGTMDDPALP